VWGRFAQAVIAGRAERRSWLLTAGGGSCRVQGAIVPCPGRHQQATSRAKSRTPFIPPSAMPGARSRRILQELLAPMRRKR